MSLAAQRGGRATRWRSRRVRRPAGRGRGGAAGRRGHWSSGVRGGWDADSLSQANLRAPAAAVFDGLADHEGWTRFPRISGATLLRPGTPVPNGVGACWIESGPVLFEEEITAFERPASVGVRGTAQSTARPDGGGPHCLDTGRSGRRGGVDEARPPRGGDRGEPGPQSHFPGTQVRLLARRRVDLPAEIKALVVAAGGRGHELRPRPPTPAGRAPCSAQQGGMTRWSSW